MVLHDFFVAARLMPPVVGLGEELIEHVIDCSALVLALRASQLMHGLAIQRKRCLAGVVGINEAAIGSILNHR